VPIADTVDQLIAISARPRDLLMQRNQRLQAEQIGVTDLTASVIGVQLSIQSLRNSSLFDRTVVSVPDGSALSTNVTGNPTAGTYQFTPIKQAQAHQLLSGGIASRDKAFGGGEVSIRFGGFVDQSVALDDLNGGAGVERGQIRITDRSGLSEIVDLRFARTIDDVVRAINSANNVDITASVDGDSLKLTDHTSAGQVTANLRVQEVGLTTTASDLGLAGVNTSADEATGHDVLRLHDSLRLDRLNDGNGVNLKQGVADLQVDLQDGTSLQVDFFAQSKGPTMSTGTVSAANGDDADITFTSVGSGESFDGYDISFVNDDDITVGNETVEIDTIAKTLRFNIDEGNTRGVHVISALNNDATANQVFTAAPGLGGDGTGVVDVTDSATTSGGAIAYNNESTIGEVIATIDAVDPAKLQARISAGGDSIELVDLTSGASTFSATSLLGGSVAEDLGLTTTAASGVITGKRRLSGLKTVLLDSLAGGYSLGQLGTLDLTDRSGATATVNLASAETLDDVIQAINGTGIGIAARVNSSRNGLLVEDTSGGASNLIIANSGDSTTTADKLRIATNAATSTADSGSLDLQTFNEQQLLSSLNGGRGVDEGSFLVTDTSGQVGAVNLAVAGAETVGEVIDLVNGLGIGVQARINDSGDGILLVDTAGGGGDITVTDVGDGTAAADLLLAGTSEEVDLGGTPTKVIDGATTLKVTLDAADTLDDLVEQINALEGNVSASVFNSGAGATPFRLSLTGQITGARGELLVDASSLSLNFQEIVAAQDALVLVGTPDSASAGAFASSATNEFDSLLDGITISVDGTSTEAVTVTVEQNSDTVTKQLELFVTQYNKLQDKIEELAFFNETDETAGVLFGSSSVLRIQFDVANAITGRYLGAGSIQSLAELGLSLDDQGRLSFDKTEFQDKYDADRGAVEQFFTQAEFGAAHKLFDTIERLSGAESSVLVSRAEALQVTIDDNFARVTALSAALETERERLLLSFYRMESTISRIQNNLSAISQIQALPPL
jgi:flagellar hook-associated protein 2